MSLPRTCQVTVAPVGDRCPGGGLPPRLFYFMPQAWSSDNTDFLDRLRIQHGSSLAYPPRSTTAHVSAVPNHQTGRASPFHARAVLAMLGGMGFELDLSKMSEEEKAQVWPLLCQALPSTVDGPIDPGHVRWVAMCHLLPPVSRYGVIATPTA